MDFFKQYDKWLTDCLNEYNARFGDERKYHTLTDKIERRKDYDPSQLVEFSDTGDAYPHGAFGTAHVRRCVTPWEQSRHYCA